MSSSPTSSPRVVVVGAGFGGLGAARALLRRGIADVTVLERADAVGGVWRDNTYPGAACDVPSALYSWSWALNPRWGRRYSGQAEILAYLRDAARREGLLDLVRTGQEVVSATWDAETAQWHLVTAGGATYDADAVVWALGQLSNPVVPDLPGVADFEGPAFHSAQWRHDVDLAGRRVAVVGTGASAIQLVPGIVEEVAAMTVFQRSAPYVVPKPDTRHTVLHHTLVGRLAPVLRLERRAVLALTELYNGALAGSSRTARPLLALVRAVWWLRLRRWVRDPVLRRALRPDHRLGCKRVLFSNDWYPALAREHVELVTDRVSAIEPTGVRTEDGRLHEADVLVWGTGFAATSFLEGVRVTGAGGADLHERWADGAHAHLGITVPDFPNLFVVYGPNTNLGGSSIIGMLEAQATWIAEVVGRLADGRGRGGPRALAVRREVAEVWDREMQERLAGSVWATCTSWYVDGSRITTNWPGLVAEYQQRLGTVDHDELEEVS